MEQISNKEKIQRLNNFFNTKQFSNYCKNVRTKYRYEIITKAIEFCLIAQNYDNFWNYNSIIQYLQKEEKCTDEEIEEIILKRFIQNGFLFHVTPVKNEAKILKKGLLTPSRRGINYNSSEQLEQYSTYLHEKYNGYFPKLIPNENFNQSNKKERYDTIYFGFDLNYLLKTYGNFSELSRFIMMELEQSFSLDFQNGSKEEILLLIKNKLIADSILTDEEIEKLLILLNPYIESKINTKDIILFPYKNLKNKDEQLRHAKENNRLDYLERRFAASILDENRRNWEFAYSSDIPPEDLIIINTDENPKVKCL